MKKTDQKEQRRRRRLRAVIQTCEEILNSRPGLWRAKQVTDSLKRNHELEMSKQYIFQVLRHDVGAKYKRIRKIPFLGNTLRCFVLRQHYGIFMINQLASDVRVINLDQTWINDLEFRRQKWRKRGFVNSVLFHQVAPKIAVQMAICTQGKVYCALS